MADDPNRDILPVKEGSCADTCRSSIDPRERHFVCKLDRYQLEDRYLRLLDEASSLKKLSNCQEDKIKRLATKLMRVSNNPRACMVALDVHGDKNKIIDLELENAKLKDKISVLRNQLLSHTITGRSSSRSRNPQARPSSGRITCRSESSRTKIPSCHCIVETGNDDNHPQNYLAKIESLENQKREMSCRIAELEKELSSSATSNQREKVAENVEYIRVWRQMKQLNDKLIAARNTNESLNAQISDLKRTLEDTTKNSQEVKAALATEKKRVSEIDEQMLKVKDTELALREKDERIRDLMNEIKVLQQHNNELIALSSNYGQIEVENAELKKKVTDQLRDQQTLKSAFNTEQANIAALQAANEKLLQKLQDLQKNIDLLTVQLMSFQTQTEKHESASPPEMRPKQLEKKVFAENDRPERYKNLASQVEKCKRCCEAYERILQLEEEMNEKIRNASKSSDKCCQTEFAFQIVSVSTVEQGTSAMTPIKLRSWKEGSRIVEGSIEAGTMTENSLTPEKMLKLLEQAQINTPLDPARIARDDAPSAIDYNGILDLNRRNRTGATPTGSHPYAPTRAKLRKNDHKLYSDENIQDSTIIQNFLRLDTETFPRTTRKIQVSPQKYENEKVDAYTLENFGGQSIDPSKILSILFNILREYSSMYELSDESTTLYRQVLPAHVEYPRDINNNDDAKDNRISKKNLDAHLRKQNFPNRAATDVTRRGCGMKKSCANDQDKLRHDRSKKRAYDANAKGRNHVGRFMETGDCTCNDRLRCYGNSDNGHQCCTSCSMQSIAISTSNSQNLQTGARSMPITSAVDVAPSLQDTGSTVYVTRTLQEDCNSRSYRPWENIGFPDKKSDPLNNNQDLSEYMKQLKKCRELLATDCTSNKVVEAPANRIVDRANILKSVRHRYPTDDAMLELQKSTTACSANCPNDCADIPSMEATPDSFPLIIADGQGLMEIHILCLQLSTSARQILFREDDISKVSLYISWDIWDQETAYTPALMCGKLSFNSSFVYRIPNLFAFFNYVLSEYVIFQTNVVRENEDGYVVARAKLCIKDILDYPQNKLHYIAPVNSIIPCSLGMNFGQLSLWARLSCDVEKVEAFKKQCGLYSTPEFVKASSVATDQSTSIADSFLKDMGSSLNAFTLPKSEDTQLYVSRDASSELLGSFERGELDIDTSEMSSTTKESTMQNILGRNALTAIKEEAEPTDRDDPDADSFNPVFNFLESSFKVDDQDNRDVMTEEEKEEATTEVKAKDEEQEQSEEQWTEKTSAMDFDNLMATEAEPSKTDNSTIHDVAEVFSEKNWGEYRQRSLLSFSSTISSNINDADQSTKNGRTKNESGNENEKHDTNNDKLEKDTIIIEVANISLSPESSVMQNDEIQLLYVEYAFLGHRGADMETISVAKSKVRDEKMTYNFRKKFPVNEKTNKMERNSLRAMLDESMDPNIKFYVVSEPHPEENDVKECVEVGVASFNLREYALGSGNQSISLPIINVNEEEQIGVMKIFVLGLDTMRQCLGEIE